jgi:hypothetical protein
MPKKGHLRNAQYVATGIAVLCPHCGAEQPSPDNGSEIWLPEQIQEARRECVSCDEPFAITRPSKIAIDMLPITRGSEP